jgi:hypothetical protein
MGIWFCEQGLFESTLLKPSIKKWQQESRDHPAVPNTLGLHALSGKIPNRLPFLILSSLVNPADQTRPNSHQFLKKSIASKSILFFY